MGLSTIVVSRDWQEVSVLECILGGLHIDCDVESQPERAQAKLERSKIDALIVDCDLSGSDRLLRNLQRNSHFPWNTPLVVMSGPRPRQEVDAPGALFSFEKPISVEQAVRTLSAARNLILEGRLRYHRAGLEVPVNLSFNSHGRVEAGLVNVSQGGLQVHTDAPVETTKNLRISLDLPGA